MSESRIERLKASCGIFTALCSSTLESAVQTGMSMKARGFGTGKRSFAHSFKFRFGDGVFLFVCILLFSAAMIYSGTGKLRADFYPRIAVSSEPLPMLCFAVLCAIPFILEVKGARVMSDKRDDTQLLSGHYWNYIYKNIPDGKVTERAYFDMEHWQYTED